LLSPDWITQGSITYSVDQTHKWRSSGLAGGQKKPKTRQLHNLAGIGALSGAFWGMLFGIIFFVPILGMAMGATMGAFSPDRKPGTY